MTHETTVMTPIPQPISLLLSGGGFRATLFHLGTVRYLRETNRLKDVNEVFSVSGGSILAGHLAVNWGDYVGDEQQWDRAASELVRFTQSGLRESIVSKSLLYAATAGLIIVLTVTAMWCWLGIDTLLAWLLLTASLASECALFVLASKWFLPIRFLEVGYRRLFRSATQQTIRSLPVRFHFLATNLTTGQIASFTDSGLDLVNNDSHLPPTHIPTSAIPIAQCVAASSAFPPMFSPVPIDPAKLKVDESLLNEPQYLSDGGVFDNLGLRAKQVLSPKQQLTVVSDAERRFDWVTTSKFRSLVGRTTRSTDILMNRVNRLEFELLDQSKSAELNSSEAVKFIRLQEDFPNVDGGDVQLSPDLKRRCRRIRTDLDAFSPNEIQILFCAGYIAAKHAFEGVADMGDGVLANANGMPASCKSGRWLPFNNNASLNDHDLLGSFEDSESPRLKLLRVRSLPFWLLLLIAMTALLLNPLTIRLWQKWPSKPASMTGHTLTLASQLPESRSMLMAFLPAAQEMQFNSATEKLNLFVLETADLTAYTNSRYPAPFTFSLIPPDACRVVYQKAFLWYRESDAIVALPEDLVDNDITYDVVPQARAARLLLILGVASPADRTVAITADHFQLPVR